MAYLDSVFLLLLIGTPHLHTNDTNNVKEALSNRMYVYIYVYICRTVTLSWK